MSQLEEENVSESHGKMPTHEDKEDELEDKIDPEEEVDGMVDLGDLGEDLSDEEDNNINVSF